MKQESADLMVKIAQILTEDDRGKQILTIVLGMAHDDNF